MKGKLMFGLTYAASFLALGFVGTPFLRAATDEEGTWVTIRNGAVWKDTEGNPVQAHGAGFLLEGDTWYMIGEDRSNPWHPDVNMYSSKDLVNWKFENKIIKNEVTHPELGKTRMIERPKLMKCPSTGKYVVWCHWEAKNYGASEAGVFYCDSVNGDYKFHRGDRPLNVKSRDCNIFVDDDGTAYFISTIEENTHLGLFKLSEDYLEPLEYTELFKDQRREAPAIVRVGDTYYMLSSACSGWDPNPCKLSYTKSLTDGWSDLETIGNEIAFDTQAASILTVKGTKATTYLYVGDRWMDPGLPESTTIIFPITFGDNKCNFDYSESFDINFTTGEVRPTDNSSRYIDRSKWKVAGFSSQETKRENAPAKAAFDGDLKTYWRSEPIKLDDKEANRKFGRGERPKDGERQEHRGGKHPRKEIAAAHYVAVDMGGENKVAGFLCVPPFTDKDRRVIRDYAFEVSNDGKMWKRVSSGKWLPYWSEVYFEPVNARYFRLVSLKGRDAGIAEIQLLKPEEASVD